MVSFTKGNDGFGSIQAMRKSYMAVVKLGFFTRLLERAGAADRYRFAAEQARHAEQLGFETVWVAQHFDARPRLGVDPGVFRGFRHGLVRPHSGL